MHIQPDQNPAPNFLPAMPYEEHLWRVVLEGLNDLIQTFVHVAPSEEAQEVALCRSRLIMHRLHDFVGRLEQIAGGDPLHELSNTVYTVDLLVEEMAEVTTNITFAVLSSHISAACLVMASEIKEHLGIVAE